MWAVHSQRQLWHSEGIPRQQLLKKSFKVERVQLLTFLIVTTHLKATESPPTLPHSNYKHPWFQQLSSTRNKAQTNKESSPPIAQLETGFWNPHVKTGDEAVVTTVT